MARPFKREHVTAEEFVRIWQSSETTAEVAEKTGLKKSGVSNRASRFKTKGIPLKDMRNDSRGLDVQNLKALAKKLAPKLSKPVDK